MEAHSEGTELGRYRLGRLIGSGGMGEVYLARDASLRRDVAIKFVNATAGSSDVVTRRLLQEAQAVAALDHPGICPVHDVGTDAAGRPYMVMQYVPGETLASRLARGPLPLADTLRISAQIADALAAAHRRGIIHRDLKPQNVMLTPSGQTKLLDFGIAKVLPATEGASSETTVTSLTQAHGVFGTPAYMSPEQIQQQPLDGKSDLFSLGCILFECLTGRRAFEGKQSADVLGQILHVQPPSPSGIRRELDARHDELCRRLLAKDPTERFQSAEEVVGALRVLDPSRARSGRDVLTLMRSHWKRIAAVAFIALAVAAAVWRSTRFVLPAAPPDAARYYQLGTDALREGAFHSAATALSEAVRVFPNYALAHARLAEAHAEMDDERAAAQDLVRVSELVPNTSRLPNDARLRLDAIRALVLRRTDAAVAIHRELATRNPADAGAWVDLARAQEAAAQLSDARTSLERAITIGPRYAAAHLRLGIIHGLQGRKEQGMAALAEAERLYTAESNNEGQTEVLIRRGMLLNSTSDLVGAHDAFERARTASRTFGNTFQEVRAQIQLGSAMVSEGRLSEAEQLVSSAVRTARDAGLDTIAAEGLIDLAAALVSNQHASEAEAHLADAINLAQRRGARATLARAQTQLASVQSTRGAKPGEILRTLEPALAFCKEHEYRKLALTALGIAARAYEDLDDIPKAREVSRQALKEAEATGNDYQLAIALTNLASQANVVGSLPEALTLRERAGTIHRRMGDAMQLAFDLTNRAELLINLGRFDEADATLGEVDEGIRKKIEVFLPRQRRVEFLRVLAATFANRFAEASSRLAALPPGPASSSTSIIGSAVAEYVNARQGRPRRPGVDFSPSNVPTTAREQLYWTARTLLARGNSAEALDAATDGVDRATKVGNDELTWRFAAIGRAAARDLGNREQQRGLHDAAIAALARLRTSWGDHVRRYLARPDLIELRKASELED